MIKGIGTDIAQISRIERAMQNPRFVERVLSESERADAPDPISAAWLAKRWAAKEAASKALGTGIGGQASFHDFVVSNDALGAPKLKAETHPGQWDLSLSDDGDYACAFVVWSSYSK